MGSLFTPTPEVLKNVHVFMVTFPGQGHVNPLLRLGKRLADYGLSITFCAPEMAGESIRKSNGISGHETVPVGRGMIRFEFFEDGWEGTDVNEYMAHLSVFGKKYLPEMIRKQAELGRPVSCLVNNPFIPWVCDVAEELGIPCAVLWVQSCASFASYYHYYNKTVAFPSDEEPKIDVQMPFMPLLKHDEVPNFLRPGTPYPFLSRAILGQFKNLSKSVCILMDTFEELEKENIDYMSEICRPIKAVGPLFKPLVQRAAGAPENGNGNGDGKQTGVRADFFTPESCIEWLDTKESKSVVYASFGSIVHLEQEQVDEIAYGLLQSELPFLWVVTPPAAALKVEAHVLPEGFLEKAGDRGKVVKWAPQEEVLSHFSVGCFLTHCGWNSTIETLSNGVPVAAFPFWGDQVTDAKYLVDVFKVGVRISRGEADERIVPSEEIARLLRSVVLGSDAAELRENAEKWMKAAVDAVQEGGSSYKKMEEFVEEIVAVSGNLR